MTNNRHLIINICLVGMEMAWTTPFVLIFYQAESTKGAMLLFGGLWLWLLVWLGVLKWLNYQKLDSPYYELVAFTLIIVSSLGLISIWPYEWFALNQGGIGHLIGSLADIKQGLPVELWLILFNLFLWQRAANVTSREKSFFAVGLNFRLGILILVFGSLILNYFSEQNIMFLLWIYFSLSLIAVAIAKIDEKATGVYSTGQILPLPRLLQLLFGVLTTIGLTALVVFLYPPEKLAVILAWIAKPLFAIFSLLFIVFARVLFFILEPIIAWISPALILIFSELETMLIQLEPIAGNEQTGEAFNQFIASIPPWVWTTLRCAIIAFVILIIFAFIFIFLDRFKPYLQRNEQEKVDHEAVTYGEDIFKRGLNYLKDWAKLVQQYGLSWQLLTAISVENIYANLCRLARRYGHPRPPSQPPDDYLPVLSALFVGQNAALARITAAYMQVHYGDHPVTQAELAQIKKDYEAIQKADVIRNSVPDKTSRRSKKTNY